MIQAVRNLLFVPVTVLKRGMQPKIATMDGDRIQVQASMAFTYP